MGRPPKPIDWNLVERKMQAGCTLVEIAGDFNHHPDSFGKLFKKEFGDNFTSFSCNYHSTGKGNIRHTQYEKALEGNTQMLILLGKLWLDQTNVDTDKSEINLNIKDYSKEEVLST